MPNTPRVAGLVTAVLIGLAACAPVPAVVDTPKNGDRVALRVDQPMQVRWANPSPAHGAWVLEGSSGPALAAVGRTTEHAPGAAMALDIFGFRGAQEGLARLTFAYRRKDGTAPTADERITVDVKVS